MYWAIPAILVAVVVVAFLYGRAAYYRRIFSPAHFEEVHSTLLDLLHRTRASAPSTGEGPAEPSGAVTSAGLVLGVSHQISGDSQVLHISLSQHRHPTTAAV